MTIGVLNRVEQLADRPKGEKPDGAIAYKSLVPLNEIIAEAFGVGVASKKVKEEYRSLISKLGSEFYTLIDAEKSELESATVPEVVEGIMRVREGKLYIRPGYDGEYGKIKIFGSDVEKETKTQTSLF